MENVSTGKVGRILVFRITEGEDLTDAIIERAKQNRIHAGIFILIGSLKDVVLGYYEEGKYKHIQLSGPLEIASCMGNMAVDEKGEVVIHAHLVVSNEKCEAFGGHLMKDSHVGATAELMIIEGSDLNLQRTFDEKTKLKLLKMD